MLGRSALEHMTHRITVRRRLPPPFSAVRLYASSEGGLRYLRPSMKGVDPSLLRLAAELVRPGDVIWDIGANLGLFSFAAAAAAGPRGYVLAVEPDAMLVGLLRRSTAANQRQALVDVLPVAVAGDLGVGRFHIARRNRSTNYLDGYGTAQTGGIRSTQLVPTVTLNWLATQFPSPNLVKIDVEEAESMVLAGGSDVLRAHPTIICEVAARNAAEIGNILTCYGYVLYNGEEPAAGRTPAIAAPPNTVAISTSRP
jgi:FkbM family methyltransferase